MYDVAATSPHADLVAYIFQDYTHPELLTIEDYQNIEKGSLIWQIIKNTTNFYANFAKYR